MNRKLTDIVPVTPGSDTLRPEETSASTRYQMNIGENFSTGCARSRSAAHSPTMVTARMKIRWRNGCSDDGFIALHFGSYSDSLQASTPRSPWMAPNSRYWPGLAKEYAAETGAAALTRGDPDQPWFGGSLP